MKPIIAILANVDDSKDLSLAYTYIHAIESSGGLPLVIPYTEDECRVESYLALCDGLMLTGGDDICPSYYGMKESPNIGKLQPFRDKLELAFFAKAKKLDKPMLAICRGAQLVNVALGGSLIQDIPTELDTDIMHKQTEGKFEYSHEVIIERGSPLYMLFGKERIRANSFHHQAIARLGEGLIPMAYAQDGIIEAAYMPKLRYVRIYQWHPERLLDKDKYNRSIFSDFIESCREKKK